jgi:alpha-mannosidase
VSLLNDCKYGHDIKGNVMRLSLLRGSTDPDPDADLGVHHFTYSLFPHAGTWELMTIPEAYALNDPPIVWSAAANRPRQNGAAASWVQPFVEADRSNVIIETIKQAEDGQGLIVRLFECKRRRGPVRIRTTFEIDQAWRTNILEENLTELPAEKKELQIRLRPYQIVTLRLIPVSKK